MYNTNILGVVPAGITILQNVNTHYLFIIITFFNYIASNYILGKFPKKHFIDVNLITKFYIVTFKYIFHRNIFYS